MRITKGGKTSTGDISKQSSSPSASGPPGTTTLKNNEMINTCSGQRVLEWPRKSLTGKQSDQWPCRGSTREADDRFELACHAQVLRRMTKNFPG